MDLFLCAAARFFLGNTSGLCMLATVFGEEARTVPAPLGEVNLRFGPFSLFSQKLVVIALAALAAWGLWYALQASRWGKSLRALAQNREAAMLAGIRVGRVSLLAFALAGGLSALAGAATAPVVAFTPFGGRLTVIKAFAISRIGGGSVRAVVGLALLLGVSESLVAAYLTAQYSELLPLAGLILFMLFQIETLGPEEHLTTTHLRAAARAAFRLPGRRWGWTALGLALLATPLLLELPAYAFHLLILSGVLAICVTSSDLLYGFAGLPSLAQGAFWGVGAYASALFVMRLGLTPPSSLLATLALALALGALVGALGVRAGRHWTLFTFVTTILFTLLALTTDELTGGPNGLVGIPLLSVHVPGVGQLSWNPFLDKAGFYGLVAAALGLVLVLKAWLARSWFGHALVAIREDEGLARSIGIPSRRYKVALFALCASIASLGGFFYAHYLTYLHPDLFDYIGSFNILMMNKLGGLTTLLGPALAPLAVTVVDELTRPVNAYIAEVVFGVLLIVTILYLPDGLVGRGKRGLARAFPNRFGRGSDPAGETKP